MQKKLRPGLSRPSWPITKDFSNPARAHEAEGRDEGVLTTEASPPPPAAGLLPGFLVVPVTNPVTFHGQARL
jgi:hypothetical protein